MDGLTRYAASDLHAFVVRALRAAGASPDDARLVADGLVAADLRGVHSHGVVRTAIYVRRLQHGSINPSAVLSVVRDAGPVVVVDAQGGFGIAMATRAMDLAIARAQEHGVGFVGVRNSNHCGMLAHLAMRASARELIGLALSNADAQVAPWGARTKYLGTNPMAIAVPAGTEPPIVLDMATSIVPHQRIKTAAARGEPIPEGWGIDRDGRPATDPHRVLDGGAILPFGGPKGSGLSLMIDILAGLLPGAASGPEIIPLYEHLDRVQGVGHLLAAVSPASFGPPEQFLRRVAQLAREVRALPPMEGVQGVYLPGEIEHRRALEYAERGIPLPAETEAELSELAADLGIPAPAAMPG